MRLCLVTTELAGVTRHSGGIGSQYATLIPVLAERGHQVVVLTGEVGEERALELNGAEVRVARLPGRVELRVPALAHDVNRQLGRLGQFDAVLAPEYGAAAVRYARRRQAGPLATNLQTSIRQIAAISGWPLRRRLLPHVVAQRALERSQARRSDALIAPTVSILNRSRREWRLDSKPSAVVPNTADLRRVRELARQAPPPELPRGAPLVAYSGRLEARKGVHHLVTAMKAVWDAHPDAQLALAGGDEVHAGGPMSTHLRSLAGDWSAQLHVLGALPPERLFAVLAAADVVALPSLWEAFGIAALEAMALGKAVVLTGGHGFDEFTHPGVDAEIVPPGDVAALGAAISGLLAHEDRRGAMGRAAAAQAEKYDVRIVAEQLTGELRRLLVSS